MHNGGLDFPHRSGYILITIFSAIFALVIAIHYAGQPLLEFHGFRQTQTALTSYWMMKEGWRLDYQTPVAGYPWSIPFEFPIFQSIAAFIATLGIFPLDVVGRLLSFGFLLACAWPAFLISRRLELLPEVPWVFCALLWSTPIYLFWGRTFMIETAALFFTFAAIPYAIDLFSERPRWKSALQFLFWMTLGMLQKITTALPVIFLMALLVGGVHLKTLGLRLPPREKIIQVFLAFIIPVALGELWVYYTDYVKLQNTLGMQLTSGALASWNFGTLQQRLDLEVLKTIFWDRVIARNACGVLGIAVLGAATLWVERRIKIIVLICSVLFALPIAIFINLHFIHDYYQTACVLFLTGALAVSIVYLLRKFDQKHPAALIATWIVIIINLWMFKIYYFNYLQEPFGEFQTQTLAVSDVLRRYTPQTSGIVIFGSGWSSEIAYYAERKSFTVPGPGWFSEHGRVWNNPAAFLGDTELGAVVFCVSGGEQSLAQILERPDVIRQPKLFKVENCYLWMPDVESIVLSGSNRTLLPIDFSMDTSGLLP